MTIDERLEYLITVQKSHDDQIVALIERDAAFDARMDTLSAGMEKLTSKMETLSSGMVSLSATVETLTKRTIQAMDAITRLGHIAASHDERLDDLEGRRPA